MSQEVYSRLVYKRVIPPKSSFYYHLYIGYKPFSNHVPTRFLCHPSSSTALPWQIQDRNPLSAQGMCRIFSKQLVKIMMRNRYVPWDLLVVCLHEGLILWYRCKNIPWIQWEILMSFVDQKMSPTCGPIPIQVYICPGIWGWVIGELYGNRHVHLSCPAGFIVKVQKWFLPHNGVSLQDRRLPEMAEDGNGIFEVKVAVFWHKS